MCYRPILQMLFVVVKRRQLGPDRGVTAQWLTARTRRGGAGLLLLCGRGVGEKEELLGAAPVTSCDGETTKRMRVVSRTRFVGHRLRTFTGRATTASSELPAMGTKKEAGTRCHEEDGVGAGWCRDNGDGAKWGTGQRSGRHGRLDGRTAICRAVGAVWHASREKVRQREGLMGGDMAQYPMAIQK
jgi:hypothetical protein